MKYYIVAGFVVLAAAAAVWMAKSQNAGAPGMDAHEKWRRSAVEKETSVRPDHYAATKWTAEEAARAPAAANKK